jgi:SAM-dependent methyltransferase
MKPVHQNIFLDGKDLGENGGRLGSKFMNEGKWENFIEPLLKIVPIVKGDYSDLSFLEIGCNAGLFLHLAKRLGFRDVAGIEQWENPCRVGEIYRDSLGLDYKIINEEVTQDYDFEKLPCVDVVVMANFHYHIANNIFVYLLDALKNKARFVLIVSDGTARHVRWRAHPSMEEARKFFREWEEVATVYPIPGDGPHPRKNMYSFLYKSKLKRVPLDMIRLRGYEEGEMDRATKDFIEKALHSRFDVRSTEFYNLIKKRQRNKTIEYHVDFCQKKKELARSIRDNGMEKPIMTDNSDYLIDGGHRFFTIKALGYKSIITRII